MSLKVGRKVKTQLNILYKLEVNLYYFFTTAFVFYCTPLKLVIVFNYTHKTLPTIHNLLSTLIVHLAIK